ncbi:putative ammonium transporter 3-like protein [Leptotrombidium deliense]|uniref:Ammonium transporter n=1 Tax=Leptotrombidium deliense TaxID=299467 RepID=A0A443SNI9_9ACAR|nr:putative ammonium transporter 3-like protein [Leptotrombidium deliense]
MSTAQPAVNESVVDEEVSSDDATWILTSSFVIFTMQTGFGLLESGACSMKNEANIMMKNVVDVVLGGLFYWAIGYGLQFGNEDGVTGFYGWGDWFLDASSENMGKVFATFIFQLSFCTTATTIVSGAMAERTDYSAYVIFSSLNTIVYCIPAGWVWRDTGFLYKLGALDYAGCACVHLIGGVSAFVAAYMLKPRVKRYENGTNPLQMGNPTNAIVGNFSLWWGWLGFNCGSTFGVRNNKWAFAQRAAITTLNGSYAGGLVALFYSYYRTRKVDVSCVVNGILAGLVAVTSGAGFFKATDSLIIGAIGSIISCIIPTLMDRHRIDDPVGAVAVHGGAGAWGALAVGLFAVAEPDLLSNGGLTRGQCGLCYGCGPRLFGVQLLTVLAVSMWSGITTWVLLAAIDKFVPIRMCIEEEILGADYWKHAIKYDRYDYESLISDMVREGLEMSEHMNKLHSVETSFEWHRRLLQFYCKTAESKERANVGKHSKSKRFLYRFWKEWRNKFFGRRNHSLVVPRMESVVWQLSSVKPNYSRYSPTHRIAWSNPHS